MFELGAAGRCPEPSRDAVEASGCEEYGEGPRQRPSSDVRHVAGGVAEAGGSHSVRAVTFRPSPRGPRARSSGRQGPRGPSQGPDAHAGQLADVSSGPLALCPSGPGSRGQNSRAPLMEGSVLGSTPGRPPSLAAGCLASRGTGGGAAGPSAGTGESRRPPEAHVLPGKGQPRHFWTFLQAGDRGQHRPRKWRLMGNPLGAEVPGVVGWGSRPESGTMV